MFCSRENITAIVVCCLCILAPKAQAQSEVISGWSLLFLNTDRLDDLLGLELSSKSPEVTVNGSGVNRFYAFPVNTREHPARPTTFAYTPNLSTFSGTIEYSGSLMFNNDSFMFGDFTYGYDESRAMHGNSGFFIASNSGIDMPIFDLDVPSRTSARSTFYQSISNMRITPEFATYLRDNGYADADRTYLEVGKLEMSSQAVPEPGTISLLGLSCLATLRRRRFLH